MKHIPVLTKEVIKYAALSPKSVVVDGTLGSGGHAREIAKSLGKFGILVTVDRDATAFERVGEIKCRGAVHPVHGNFTDIATFVEDLKIPRPTTILLDLGWSMDQFADPSRGFSFMVDGPLDMRLDMPAIGDSAADIVNSWTSRELADLFYNLADEKKSREIAAAIVRARGKKKITTTMQLANLIADTLGSRGKTHPATKVFQALRMQVNHELSDITSALTAGIESLAPGGRMLVITFHSIEDRLVKQIFAEAAKEKTIHLVTKKPVIASGAELRSNPRARSAKLRVIQKN